MLAAVDIGSLTVRLLIGTVVEGRIHPHIYRRMVTRLGTGLSQDQGLLPQMREQTLIALGEIAQLVHQHQVSAVTALGTEAMRRAGQAQRFVAEIREQCGLEVEIIDGEREASLTTRGVMAALAPQPVCSLIVDLGGGSTELALVQSGRLPWQTSLQLGVVRLATESAATQEKRVAGLLELAEEQLERAGLLGTVLSSGCELVGTAGTVTTLAAIDLKLRVYDWRRINNRVLSLATVRQLRRSLGEASLVELQQLPGLEPGREEFIAAGATIIEMLMVAFGKTSLRLSDFGLLEGALLELAEGRAD